MFYHGIGHLASKRQNVISGDVPAFLVSWQLVNQTVSDVVTVGGTVRLAVDATLSIKKIKRRKFIFYFLIGCCRTRTETVMPTWKILFTKFSAVSGKNGSLNLCQSGLQNREVIDTRLNSPQSILCRFSECFKRSSNKLCASGLSGTKGPNGWYCALDDRMGFGG